MPRDEPPTCGPGNIPPPLGPKIPGPPNPLPPNKFPPIAPPLEPGPKKPPVCPNEPGIEADPGIEFPNDPGGKIELPPPGRKPLKKPPKSI